MSTAYSYDDNDRLTQTGGKTFSYDNNGSTLSETLDGETTHYRYNAQNQLVETTQAGVTTQYHYNVDGIRTGQGNGTTQTSYLVDQNRDYAQVLLETQGTSAVVYTYGDDLISQSRAGVASYYHYDGLGSTRALSDGLGAVTDTYHYEAFGDVLHQTGVTENSYLFAGEQFDQNLNQYYLRARYYDQGVGRFTQMDTWLGNNYDPITLHKYLYANVDPVMYTDPSGNFSLMGTLTAINNLAILSTVAVTSFNATSLASEGDLYGAGKEVAIGAISVAAFLKGPQLFRAVFGSCASWCTLFYNFSQAERAIIAEAKAFQAAGAFEKARAAIASGIQTDITVGARTVTVVPGFSGSGMTLFGDDVFIIGSEAIVSKIEFSKTLLHEFYRLSFQKGVNAGAVGGSSAPTTAAFNFAEEAAKLFK